MQEGGGCQGSHCQNGCQASSGPPGGTCKHSHQKGACLRLSRKVGHWHMIIGLLLSCFAACMVERSAQVLACSHTTQGGTASAQVLAQSMLIFKQRTASYTSQILGNVVANRHAASQMYGTPLCCWTRFLPMDVASQQTIRADMNQTPLAGAEHLCGQAPQARGHSASRSGTDGAPGKGPPKARLLQACKPHSISSQLTAWSGQFCCCHWAKPSCMPCQSSLCLRTYRPPSSAVL